MNLETDEYSDFGFRPGTPEWDAVRDGTKRSHESLAGWTRFRSADVVFAVQIDQPFKVLVADGHFEDAEPGDYLVRGIGGELFPLPAATFLAAYVEVDDLGDGSAPARPPE
jgi:hypothetical protein